MVNRAGRSHESYLCANHCVLYGKILDSGQPAVGPSATTARAFSATPVSYSEGRRGADEMSGPGNADPVPKWEQLREAIVAAELFQGSAALAREGVYPPQFWFH